MDEDLWLADPADHWKDAEWKTRDTIRRVNEHLEMALELAPRDLLLRMRANFLLDRRMTDFVARIDRQLERRFGIRPGEPSSSDS
jgi:hypothetical protein